MDSVPYITILGGGPAGLSVGYFAGKHGLGFKIYEALDRTGGNAITLQHGDFRYDSGAHRFHDRDPEITRELLGLMGDDLEKIDAPSQIYHMGKFIGFPLSPLNLIFQLGPVTFFKAGLELIKARLKTKDGNGSFEDFATRMYGKTLAQLFLLNYSEKLWGKPGKILSPRISGRRLKGLDLETFLKETFLGRRGGTTHLEGSFYYPRGGYGTVVDNLARECGSENIQTSARITKIIHSDHRVRLIEINHEDRLPVDEVVSTLPLPLLLRLMEPTLNEHILEVASMLRFRNLILVVLFLDRERVTENASIYIPDRNLPITRIYEPKNRSEDMVPPGKTSLCVEIPCDPDTVLWTMDDRELFSLVQSHLMQLNLLNNEEEIIDSTTHRMVNAYPILDLKSEEIVSELYGHLSKFQNLMVTGRNGRFVYTHLHDMLRFGMEVADELRRQKEDR